MEIQLTNSEKYEILDIDLDELCKEIKREVFAKELYSIKNEELGLLQEAIGRTTELELEAEDMPDNTRKSFYISNNKVIVIKSKRINMKLLFDILRDSYGLIDSRIEKRIAIVIGVLFKIFFNILDKDTTIVYSFLCNEYFIHARCFSNAEINDQIRRYLKLNLGLNWEDGKIIRILRYLEDDIQVIECRDGLFYVKDKIVF